MSSGNTQADVASLEREAAFSLFIERKSNHLASLDMIAKSMGLPYDADPTHVYSHRSGEYGDYRFWWTDRLGNYWLYTNAPEDHVHNDPRKGEPFISMDQPMPHTAPEFFTPEGLKRHAAAPAGSVPKQNPAYNISDPMNTWYEVTTGEDGLPFYIYLDKDVKDNPSLYVSYNLRIVDSNVPAFRKVAAHIGDSAGSKGKLVAALLCLIDQGCYDVETLLDATVGDLNFIGDTVQLLNRKFVCDDDFYKYLVSLKAQRPDPGLPLFLMTTSSGLQKVGKHYISALFDYFRISPVFLQSWHASQKYVKSFARLMAEGTLETPEGCDRAALNEVAAALGVDEDVTYLVNPQVRVQVMTNFLDPEAVASMVVPDEEEAQDQEEAEPTDKQMKEEAKGNEAEDKKAAKAEAENPVAKSLTAAHSIADGFGVLQINSKLEEFTAQEQEFSDWLHQQPLHMVGVLPEAAYWADSSEPQEAVEEPVEEETQKSLPVTITIVRPVASRDDIIEGLSPALAKSTVNYDNLKKLKGVDVIYTSDLPRAMSTALFIQSVQDKAVTVKRKESLRTMNFGEHTGKPGTLMKSLIADLARDIGPSTLTGEDYAKFEDRVWSSFNEIVKSVQPGTHVCVVTHQLPALIIQARMLSPYGRSLFKSLTIDPGSMSTFRMVGDEFEVVGLNNQ